MVVLSYERAVEICATQFELVLARPHIEALTPFAGAEFHEPIVVGPAQPLSASQLRQAPAVWVNTAKTNIKAHEALITAAKAMRQNGEILPRPVEVWLIALALGDIAPAEPTKRENTDIVEGLVYHTVAALCIFTGFSATRNQETSLESQLPVKRCACDVVAEAMRVVRRKFNRQLPQSYDRVRKIWLNAKKDYPFFPDEYGELLANNPTGIWEALSKAA